MKESYYKKQVNKVYGNLTDSQLIKQMSKFRGSRIQHEQGKYSRALNELLSRKKEDV